MQIAGQRTEAAAQVELKAGGLLTAHSDRAEVACEGETSAGTVLVPMTDTGRPYFVMELIRGIRITDYCDQNDLATRDRLDLFIPICAPSSTPTRRVSSIEASSP